MKQILELFSSINGAVKIALFLFMIVLFIPFLLLFQRFDPAHPFRVPMIFYRMILSLLGIRLKIFGTPSTASPVLFVANHTSYLDIIILGAVLPASFIAKSEVAGWPLFGFLAKLQNTIFIERRSTRAADQRTQMQSHFTGGRNIVLFPEGTSSDGLSVLPFKSSLFGIAEETTDTGAITVQPISLTCTKLDGFPLLREERPLYAWYGDMTLPPHLWNVFKRGRFTVEVTFHPVLPPGATTNRKLVAAACQEQVARGIEQSLTGREPMPAPLLPPPSAA